MATRRTTLPRIIDWLARATETARQRRALLRLDDGAFERYRTEQSRRLSRSEPVFLGHF